MRIALLPTALLALSLTALSSAALAKPLHCEIKENGSLVYAGQVNTARHKKIAIGQTPELYAYVTESENASFTLEGFLVNYDARVYAEGVLKNRNDHLTASLWTRQLLIDIQCTAR